MSSLSDLAASLWKQVISNSDTAVTVIQSVIDGVNDTASGTTPSVLNSIAQKHPDALAVIEAIAAQAGSFVGGPIGGFAAKEAVELLAQGHKMTPEEEQVWFDRQKSDA